MSLPDGFLVRLRHDTTIDGHLLVGGSPFRVAKLSSRAVALIVNGEVRVTSKQSRALADKLLELNLANPIVESTGSADLTVVIPARDRTRSLGRLLAHLGSAFPVVVVDDASQDPSSLAATVAHHGADLIRLDTNAGPAEARNLGLQRVRTAYVAFVDTDVLISPEALTLLTGHFADPRVAAVAPRIRGSAAPDGNWFQRYEEVASSLDLGPHPAAVRPWSMVSWLPSACLVARVEALGDGFDPALRVAEDVDLTWRLLSEGHRIRYEPAALAWHDSRDTLRDWLGRKVYYGTGGDLLARRHGDLLAPAVLTPVSALAIGSLLAQRRWSVPVTAACAALMTRRIRAALPVTSHRTVRSARLASIGLWATAGQSSALALRHWWPLTAPAVMISGRARRAVALAVVVDGVAAYRRQRPRLDPVRFVLARRLDDLAYGLGLWLGAWRGRSSRALRPRILWTRTHRASGQ